MKVKYPIKFVTLGEVLNWSMSLSNMISEDDFKPNVVIAVGRGGMAVARFICDFLDVDYMLFLPIRWVETKKRACEQYLADLIRGYLMAQREGEPIDKYIKEVVSGLRVTLSFEYTVDLSKYSALLVEEIVATGMHMKLAKKIVKEKWKANNVKTATLVWKSSTSPFFRPDWYLIETKDFIWFQFPWSRLGDYTQFIKVMLEETSHEKNMYKWRIDEVEVLFEEWYGEKPDKKYLIKALDKLNEAGCLKFVDGRTIELPENNKI